MHLQTIPQQLKMSTRVISELTARDHKNVLRDTRIQLLMLLAGDTMRSLHKQIGGVNEPLSRFVGDNNLRYFEIYVAGSDLSHEQNQGFSVIKDERGYMVEILLSKEHTITLLTGYDVEARHKVVKRWQELEQQQSFVVPQTFGEALRLAADQQDQIAQQRAELALAAPKVEFVDRYVQANTGSKGFRQVCKLLGAKENEFRAFLKETGVMYMLGREWTPYGHHIDAGRFETKAGVAEHGDNSHAYNQAMFTAKGVSWIAGEWAKYKVAQQVAA